MAIYGYARVSTDGQTVAAQVGELTKAGAAKVFSETASGAKADRAQLSKLLRALQPGDTLMVTRLDRLARSTRDLLNILHVLGEKQIGFKSLVDTWADTTTPHGRLMLTVLGGLAEFERELIRARTGEGRARAKARGVKFGRPSKLSAFQRQEALQRLADGERQADVARSYGVYHEEQKALANDANFKRKIRRREVKDGTTILVDKEQRILPWWRTAPNGSYALAIRLGNLVEFEKGKTAISVPTLDKLTSVIDTLISAIRNGELDAQLEAASVKPQKKAKK
jgi:DNA invertase Pin-like site-specific DNA recombinase